MRLGVVTISYRRTGVLKLFLASIKRLRQETGIDFPCVVVGDEEHSDICTDYGVCHISQTNHPATAKWNTGVKWLMEQDVDYVCILGSDDILSIALLKNLISAMEQDYDLIGINTIYFFCLEGKHKGHMRKLHSPNQVLGVARCINKRVIEQVGGVLWNKESSWGMDGICLRNIRPHVKTMKIVEGVCVDVKSAESLNKWTFWLSRNIPEENPQVFFDTLGEEEKLILSEI